MTAWFHRLLARIFGWTPQPDTTAALQCTHRLADGSPAWGPCHYRAKGTTPGYKGAGWFSRCSRCGAYAPC